MERCIALFSVEIFLKHEYSAMGKFYSASFTGKSEQKSFVSLAPGWNFAIAIALHWLLLVRARCL